MTMLRNLLGAVVVGVGAIFVPKSDPCEHWSTAPTTEILAEAPTDTTPSDP
jgi:hypothetical protein